jgi:hypothetical protein
VASTVKQHLFFVQIREAELVATKWVCTYYKPSCDADELRLYFLYKMINSENTKNYLHVYSLVFSV